MKKCSRSKIAYSESLEMVRDNFGSSAIFIDGHGVFTCDKSCAEYGLDFDVLRGVAIRRAEVLHTSPSLQTQGVVANSPTEI